MNLAFVKKLSAVKTKEEFDALFAGSHDIYEDDSKEYAEYDLVFYNIYRFHTTESLEELALFIANQSGIIQYNALTNSFLQNKNEFQLQIFELVKNKFSNEALINMYTDKYTSDVIKEAIYVMPENPISSENILKILIKRLSNYNYDYSKDSTIEKFKSLKHILSVEDLIKIYNYHNTPEEIRIEIFSKPTDTIPCEIISSAISYYHHHSDVEKLQLFESKKHKFSKEDIYKIYGGFATPTEIKEAILLMPADVIPAEIIIKQITQYYHTDKEKLQIFELIKYKLSNDDLIKIYKDYSTPQEIKDVILAMPADKIPAEIVIYVLTYYSRPSDEIKLKLFESTKYKLSNADLVTIYKEYNTPQEIKNSILAMPADKIPAEIVISAIRHYSTDVELKLKLFESIKDTITTEQLTFLYNDTSTPIAIRINALDVIGCSLIQNDIMSKLTGYQSEKDELRVKIFELCKENLTEENLIILFNYYSTPIEIKLSIVDILGEKVLSTKLLEYFLGYQSNEQFSVKLFEKFIDKLSAKDINTIFQDFSTPEGIKLHIIEKSMHMLTDLSINEAYCFSYNSPSVSLKLLDKAINKLTAESLSHGFHSMHTAIQSMTWELLKDKASEELISEALSGVVNNDNIELFNTILEFTNGKIPKDARGTILYKVAASNGNSEFDDLLWELIKDQLSSNDVYTLIKHFPDNIKKILDLCKDKLVQSDIHLLIKDTVISGNVVSYNETIDIFGYKDLPENLKSTLLEIALKYNKLDFLKHLIGELPEEFSTSEVTKELITHLVDNKHISNTFIQDIAREHLTKGNFEESSKFSKIADTTSEEPISILVEALQLGIQNSIEPNKYQALMQLINKAGIKLPAEHQHKLKAVKDNKNPDDFKFIDGLAHKLAEHYMSLNAKLSDALKNLDNDFALEVLTINGAMPKPLDSEVTVFRGMRGINEDTIENIFEYGHRAYSMGEFQKLLGYYVASSWNDADNSSYQLGGTYVSFSALVAAGFASVNGVLFEIHLPKGSPKTCGYWLGGMELVPSYINPEDIVAIYKLNDYTSVEKVFANPNAKASPKYVVGDKVEQEQSMESAYSSICHVEDEKSDVITHELYNSHEDFYDRYTEETYSQDQAQLWENFFSDRRFYEESFDAKECNPDLYCC